MSLILRFIVLGLLGTLEPLLHAQSGGSYDLSWRKIAGGGGVSSGGNYSISGTVGQPDAGKLSGGNYTLDGGFWSIIAAIQQPGAPLLSVTSLNNSVIVSWPSLSAGFTLQASTNLNNPADWLNSPDTPTVVNGQYTVTNTLSGGSKFYRLTK